MEDRQGRQTEYIERLVSLNRVSKAIKGGRHMSFNALMVLGDGQGLVGYGFGKADDVSEAIRKASINAKKAFRHVYVRHATLLHEVWGHFKSSKVMIKPAVPGTGIIAGGPVRAVMECIGVHDILSKSVGSRNSANVVKATFDAFDKLLDAREVARLRGKKDLSALWAAPEAKEA